MRKLHDGLIRKTPGFDQLQPRRAWDFCVLERPRRDYGLSRWQVLGLWRGRVHSVDTAWKFDMPDDAAESPHFLTRILPAQVSPGHVRREPRGRCLRALPPVLDDDDEQLDRLLRVFEGVLPRPVCGQG